MNISLGSAVARWLRCKLQFPGRSSHQIKAICQFVTIWSQYVRFLCQIQVTEYKLPGNTHAVISTFTKLHQQKGAEGRLRQNLDKSCNPESEVHIPALCSQELSRLRRRADQPLAASWSRSLSVLTEKNTEER